MNTKHKLLYTFFVIFVLSGFAGFERNEAESFLCRQFPSFHLSFEFIIAWFKSSTFCTNSSAHSLCLSYWILHIVSSNQQLGITDIKLQATRIHLNKQNVLKVRMQCMPYTFCVGSLFEIISWECNWVTMITSWQIEKKTNPNENALQMRIEMGIHYVCSF